MTKQNSILRLRLRIMVSKVEPSKFLRIIFFFLFITPYSLLLTPHYSFAQENNKLVSLTKQIIEAENNNELYTYFEELANLYFSRPDIKSGEHKYNEFVEFLKSLSNQKKTLEPVINYYISLTRYYQLKYLQEAQKWDEYFSQGDNYRSQLTESARKTIASISAKEAFNIYARLTLFRFHKDQEDTSSELALTDLMNAVLEYAKEALNLTPIKIVADELLSYNERGKSKELYRTYVKRLVAQGTKDTQLQEIALDFYRQGNLELSESLYDIYIERVTPVLPKEKLAAFLMDIARLFSYKDEGESDPPYAEKIFEKIESLAGKESLNEEQMYLRSFNLEKAKEYIKAKNSYLYLLQRFPQSSRLDEINFKLGIIHTYVSQDIGNGKTYFERLAKKETLSPQVISALYQLGLISQWEEDFVKAKEYYNKLSERASSTADFAETLNLTKARLQEINESSDIEFNLRMFLDVSLNKEEKAYDMTKVALTAHPYRALKKQNVNITANPSIPESGCFQVELQYLWSGQLGTATPVATNASFNTTYNEGGTKEINLVVISPTGVLDRQIDILDVY